MAADSQITAGELKIPGANKINVINFPHGKRALLAEAGIVPLSNRMVALVKEGARKADSVAENTIPLIVQEAVMQVRGEQMKLYPGHHSLAEWQDYFQRLSPAALLLAFYHRNKPRLYTITLDGCIPHKARERFAIAGCGDYLGNYLLREYTTANTRCRFGAFVAVKIAQEVSRYVEGCGLPIKAAVIQPGPRILASELKMMSRRDVDRLCEDRVFVFPEAHIERLAGMIAKEEIVTHSARSCRIHRSLENEHKRSVKAMNDAYDRELRMASKHTEAVGKPNK